MMPRVPFRSFTCAMLLALPIAGATPVLAAGSYGCFRATNDLNIRERPYSEAAIVATVGKGEVLTKRKRWCTLRGYWCAVTTAKGIEGYADKAYMDKLTSCP